MQQVVRAASSIVEGGDDLCHFFSVPFLVGDTLLYATLVVERLDTADVGYRVRVKQSIPLFSQHIEFRCESPKLRLSNGHRIEGWVLTQSP